MKVVIFGGSGMVGQSVLLECLDDSTVTSILLVGRSPCGIEDEKIEEVLHKNFTDFAPIANQLQNLDACFFCIGVSAAGMSEEAYRRVTFEFTVQAAETLLRLNPEMAFCYVTGAGTDSSENGRIMWARVKGMTENRLLQMPFRSAFMFRPGYIQPMKGVRSKTRLYRTMYAVLAPLYPVWKTLFPGLVTDTTKVGLAMIRVARDGFEKSVLETRDINAIAAIRD